MIGFIPFIVDDYLLTAIFVGIIGAALWIKREKYDLLALFIGLVVMTAGEFLFISTGVETFTRQSLFGIMPLWLPVLWAYCFVAIKRTVKVIES